MLLAQKNTSTTFIKFYKQYIDKKAKLYIEKALYKLAFFFLTLCFFSRFMKISNGATSLELLDLVMKSVLYYHTLI